MITDFINIFLQSEQAKNIANQAVADLTKKHIQAIYPGSTHYSPDKVYIENNAVQIDIPGITRAYRDLDIYPVNVKYLCIPLTDEAKQAGSPRNFIDKLFKPKNKNILATIDALGNLSPQYALSEHVHQNQNPELLPTDDEYVDAIITAITDYLQKNSK